MDENKGNDKPAEMIFRTEDGQAFEVTEEGSIGLLALGAVGLRAWRTARVQAMRKRKTKGISNDDQHATTEDSQATIEE